MSARVRFSSQPGVTHTIPGNVLVSLEDLRVMPLPSRYTDQNYGMDIFTAASIGNRDIVESLLVRDNRANDVNKAGWSALLYAAQLDHKAICELLIEKGANINQANRTGQTPLMLAAGCGNIATVEYLLSKKADVRAADSKGREALHIAASCSQHPIVKALLEQGADPNAADRDGMTPTLEACIAAHEHTLSALLAKGGNPLARNAKGEDGFALAADTPKVLEILEGSPRSLTELLVRMNLDKYEDKLREQKVDTLELFFQLNDMDLTEMKIPYGPKKRMLVVIEHYNKTKEIDIDAVEGGGSSGGTASLIMEPPPLSSEQQAINATLKYIALQNEQCKQLAMTAFEKKDNIVLLESVLPSIIACCAEIESRLARHSTSH